MQRLAGEIWALSFMDTTSWRGNIWGMLSTLWDMAGASILLWSQGHLMAGPLEDLPHGLSCSPLHSRAGGHQRPQVWLWPTLTYFSAPLERQHRVAHVSLKAEINAGFLKPRSKEHFVYHLHFLCTCRCCFPTVLHKLCFQAFWVKYFIFSALQTKNQTHSRVNHSPLYMLWVVVGLMTQSRALFI